MKFQRILSKRRDEIIVMVQERGVETLDGGNKWEEDEEREMEGWDSETFKGQGDSTYDRGGMVCVRD